MASWLPGGGGSVGGSGSQPSSPQAPKTVPPPAKPKKRERWLMTRKTWRYMADAGKLLIPEVLRKGKELKDYSEDDMTRLEEHYQRVCDQEQEFIEWEGPLEDPRILLARNRQPVTASADVRDGLSGTGSSLTTGVDYRFESLSAKFRLVLPVGQKPPPGYVQVGTRRLPLGDIPNYETPSTDNYLRLPSGLILQELPSAFLSETDWSARRCSSSSPPDSGVLSPDFHELEDLVDAEMRNLAPEESGIGSDSAVGGLGIVSKSGNLIGGTKGSASGGSKIKPPKKRNMCIQTEPLPEEFYRLQEEEIRQKEEEERLAREAEEKARKESEELEAAMMGDSVMRYLKMVRRNSKSSDQKKAERFRSMNYDPTLRNIKAKYLQKEENLRGTKHIEIQAGESILHLLKKCETTIDPSPYICDRKLSQTASELSDPSIGTPLRRFSSAIETDRRDFFSHLYSGDMSMSSLESGSVPEDYYQYLETWYRAQKAISGPTTSSPSKLPPPQTSSPSSSSAGIYIPVSALQNLRSSMPALTSSSFNVSRSTTSLSATTPSSSAKSPPATSSVTTTSSSSGFFSSVIGTSTKNISKKLFSSHPRSKSQSRGSITSNTLTISQWTPAPITSSPTQGESEKRWIHISSSRSVILEDTNLLLLHELERVALQKLACQKLNNTSDLGTTVRIPKDSSDTKPKRKNYLLKKRVLSSKKEKEKDKSSSGGPVFGVPIGQCIPEASNPGSTSSTTSINIGSTQLRKRSSTSCEPASHHSGNIPATSSSSDDFTRASRSASRTSFGSLFDAIKGVERISSPIGSGGSCESLNQIEYQRSSSTVTTCSTAISAAAAGMAAMAAVDALSLTSAAEDLTPCVPPIVMTCIRHIETYGLRTVGIFRVSSSKKRVRQLRDEFDSGADVVLNEETSIHDIATILKEFFRDLPEPLIPTELFHALIAIQRIKTPKDQLSCLQRLIQILPVPNRDTLFILLQFLGLIADNADDKYLDDGEVLTGNKMDSTNLATLFAPNLLHSFLTDESGVNKPSSNLKGQQTDRMECITAIRILIEKRESVFEIPSDQLHDLYIYLMDHFPELLDALLRRRIILAGGEDVVEEDVSYKPSSSEDVDKRDHRSFVIYPECLLGSFRRMEIENFSSKDIIKVERGRQRRRGEDTDETNPVVGKWTLNKSSNKSSGDVISRGSIKFNMPSPHRKTSLMSPTSPLTSPTASSPERGESSSSRHQTPRRCAGSGKGTDSLVYSPANTPKFVTSSKTTPEMFFGSGVGSCASSAPSSNMASPPVSPPGLLSSTSRSLPSQEIQQLVLKPVPSNKKQIMKDDSNSVSTIVEEEPQKEISNKGSSPILRAYITTSLSASSTSSNLRSSTAAACATTTVTAAIAASRLPASSHSITRSKTENLEKYISDIEKLPAVASDSCLTGSASTGIIISGLSSSTDLGSSSSSASLKEHKRYTRRRYTDSRHPTTELPDVRLEVATEMSVQKPPVRRPKVKVTANI